MRCSSSYANGAANGFLDERLDPGVGRGIHPALHHGALCSTIDWGRFPCNYNIWSTYTSFDARLLKH
jgi:hypothetical protein